MVTRGRGRAARRWPPLVGLVRRATVRWLAVAGVAASLTTGVMVRRADAHPLHTTLSELTVAPDGSVQIVLRAFLDDLSGAVTPGATRRGAGSVPPDSAIGRYLSQTLVLTDASGRRSPLAVAATRCTGDLVWVTLRAPGSIGPARLTNRVLFERWEDQVNIVQTTVGARHQTLLFTRRDGSATRPI